MPLSGVLKCEVLLPAGALGGFHGLSHSWLTHLGLPATGPELLVLRGGRVDGESSPLSL